MREYKRSLIAVVVLLFAACAQTGRSVDHAAYVKEITQWQAGRVADLSRDDGWLTLIGLFWLKPGENTFGSDAANDIVLKTAKVPAFAGSIRLEGDQAKLTIRPGVEITSKGKPVTDIDLRADVDDGGPTVLEIGSVTFHTIKRGDKVALRVRDKESPARNEFKGLEYFPTDQKWRIVARFEPYEPPKKMPIANVVGTESQESSPGALAFEVDGKKYRIDPILEKGETKLFVIFADETRRNETYGAGRYLYVDPPDGSGNVIVDFNKAYNPPCAFTNFATCPLPPEQNRLPIRIEAGEKYKH